MKLFFVFDVESIGLHGEGFAVGYVVVRDGQEIESGYFASPPEDAAGDDSDREWVSKNIPAIQPNKQTANMVRVAFWQRWMEWKEKGATMAAECGWPVEARFLNACIDWDQESRKWEGPYPLHEIASFLAAAGMDPMAKYDRLDSELPAHDPLCDARQSARLLFMALSKIEGLNPEYVAAGPEANVDIHFHPDAIKT